MSYWKRFFVKIQENFYSFYVKNLDYILFKYSMEVVIFKFYISVPGVIFLY